MVTELKRLQIVFSAGERCSRSGGHLAQGLWLCLVDVVSFFPETSPFFSFVFCLLFYVANTGSMLWASQFSGVGGTGEVSIRRHWGSAPPGQQGALRVEG